MPCQGPSESEVRRCKDQAELYQLVLDLHERMRSKTVFSSEFISECAIKLANTRQVFNTSIFFDRCTAVLCEKVRNFTEEEKEEYLYNGRDLLCVRLSYWWNKHEELDRKREERNLRYEAENEAKSAAKLVYDDAYQQVMKQHGF